jgi:Septum formation
VTGLMVRLVVIGAIVGGGILFRDRLTGGADDLKVGDCFDAKQADVVKEVQHHPCTEAHTAEVVLVSDFPGAKGATYPVSTAFDAWGDQTCAVAIMAYVGSAATLDNLGYGILYPSKSGWDGGDRGMICYVAGDSPLTKSLHAGAS